MQYFLAVGLFAGFLSGFLGIGGGVVMVPSLLFLFPYLGIGGEHYVHMALATSVTTAFFLTLSSAVAHIRMGNASRSTVPLLALGGVSGAVFGTLLASFISGILLKKLFALFLIFSAFRMLGRGPGSGVSFRMPVWLIGFTAGFVAAFFGVGGGIVAVPALVVSGFSPLEAVGTSATLLPFLTASAAVGYGIRGYIYFPAVVAMAASGVVAAQVGARLSSKAPKDLLRKLFACLLFLVAIRILLD